MTSSPTFFYLYNKMNAPKTPSKKKPMTEKQVAQIMTKRRACIQKFRETIKKTIKTSKKKSTEPTIPLEVDIPPKKKRVYKKKSTEPTVPLEVDIPPKKKRVYKKKSTEPTVPSEPAVPIEQVIEEKVVKKRVYKKKAKEPLEEPL